MLCAFCLLYSAYYYVTWWLQQLALNVANCWLSFAKDNAGFFVAYCTMEYKYATAWRRMPLNRCTIVRVAIVDRAAVLLASDVGPYDTTALCLSWCEIVSIITRYYTFHYSLVTIYYK